MCGPQVPTFINQRDAIEVAKFVRQLCNLHAEQSGELDGGTYNLIELNGFFWVTWFRLFLTAVALWAPCREYKSQTAALIVEHFMEASTYD